MLLLYELPLAEIVLDYYDKLKSRTRGYASFDYDVIRLRPGELSRVDILVAGEAVDALSLIVHRDFAQARGRALVERLGGDPAAVLRRPHPGRDRLPDHRPRDGQGEAKGRAGQVLRRRHPRKRKLLERQKAGKKRMKQLGSVELPQEAFLAVLSIEDGSRR